MTGTILYKYVQVMEFKNLSNCYCYSVVAYEKLFLNIYGIPSKAFHNSDSKLRSTDCLKSQLHLKTEPDSVIVCSGLIWGKHPYVQVLKRFTRAPSSRSTGSPASRKCSVNGALS